MQPYKAFNKRFTRKSLNDIYHKYIYLTPTTGIDGVKADNDFDIDFEISIILRKIANNSYKFSRYKEKLISKGVGKKPRVISIPTVRDRVVLKAIHLVLQDIYPECSKTLVPQLMLDKVKSVVKQPCYKSFIKVDIKEFYPSIDRDKLFKKLFYKVRKNSLRDLISQAISNTTGRVDVDRGVPQGLSISNILAEIYLYDLDFQYTDNENIAYHRYVDDVLVFSTLSNPRPLLDDIIQQFEHLNLECHPCDEINSKTKLGSVFVKLVVAIITLCTLNFDDFSFRV